MSLPSIPGGGSVNARSGDLYKYIPYSATNNVYISRTVIKKKRLPSTDTTILIQLGGSFEKIGGKDEAVGGGTQKVGSAIQQ